MSEIKNTPRFDVSAHLTELDANRILTGELPKDAAERAHLSDCDQCQDYLERLEREDANFPAPPTFAELDAKFKSASPRTLPSAAPSRWSRARQLTAVVAAAVAVGFVALFTSGPEPVDPVDPIEVDGVRAKSSYDLVVFIHDGSGARIARSHEEVFPGDRVGFKIAPAPDGHVMIVGIDQTGDIYMGYPQDTQGHSRRFFSGEQEVDIDQALELDDVLGRERLVMLICDEPFEFDDVAYSIEQVEDSVGVDVLPGLLGGCVQRELSLQKQKGTR